jgi:hypothetical protein
MSLRRSPRPEGAGYAVLGAGVSAGSQSGEIVW